MLPAVDDRTQSGECAALSPERAQLLIWLTRVRCLQGIRGVLPDDQRPVLWSDEHQMAPSPGLSSANARLGTTRTDRDGTRSTYRVMRSCVFAMREHLQGASGGHLRDRRISSGIRRRCSLGEAAVAARSSISNCARRHGVEKARRDF